MGSVKKKVNKVFNKAADKLIPKELAPFLPYASMLLPFIGGPMAGIMGSTVGRYAVPQLLTALGSAKTTGEVDLKKQALAAASSYLGGPGDESATNMEKAYMKANPNAATSTTSAGVPNAISGANGPVNTTFPDFTKIDPDKLAEFAKTYKPTGNAFLSNAKDFGMGLQRAAAGSEGFLKQASLIGGPILTQGGIDIAEGEIKDQKEKRDRLRQGIADYRSSTDELGDYYRNMDADYDRLYGGVDFAKRFLKDGGRVGMNLGGVPPEMMALEQMMPQPKPDPDFSKFMEQMREASKKARPTGILEGAGGSSIFDKLKSVTTPARTGLEALSEQMMPMIPRLPKFEKPGVEEEELLRKLQREEQEMSRQDAESSLSELFFELMGRPEDQYNQGGRVGMNMGGNPGDDISPARMKELVDFALSDGYDMEDALEYAKRMAAGETQYNQGGRVGYNKGGSSGMSLVDNKGGLTGFGGKVKDQMGLAGLFEIERLYNLLGPALGMNQGGRVGAKDGKFFGSELLGANQISDEPMIGSPAPITNEEYILGMGLDPDSMKELGIDGLLKRLFSGSGTRSLINAFTGGDMDREKLGKDMNQGGRVGMNIGGMSMSNMGSIPQTETVPQGMQLDGRGGGFIPMGAQEKKDDVPAMLAKNEFVMTSDAVKAAGGGSIQKGAQRMYDMMNQLEAQV